MKKTSICLAFLVCQMISGQAGTTLVKGNLNQQQTNLELFESNTNFSDYAYRVFGQDTYVVREDKKGKGLAKLYLLDNYGGSVNVFEKEKIHFAVPAITSDGNRMYVTKSSSKKNKKSNDVNLVIGKYENSRNGWEKASKKNEIGLEGYNYVHPFIVDDTYLYFSSNMPGGFGGMDLYRININDDISNAQNLGEKINSKKNEIFPFIDEEGYLYFTSNGHSLNQGYDLFIVDVSSRNSEISPMVDLNTTKDEFAYSSYDGNEYFSSNRDKSYDDNIFIADKNREIKRFVTVSGYLRNETSGVAQALVMIQENNQSIIKTLMTDEKGFFTMELESKSIEGKNLLFSKQGFVNLSVPIDTKIGEIFQLNPLYNKVTSIQEIKANETAVSKLIKTIIEPVITQETNTPKKLIKQKPIIKKHNINVGKENKIRSNSSKFSVIVGSFTDSFTAQKVIKNKQWTIIKSGRNFRISAYDSNSEIMAERFLKDIRKSIPDAWIMNTSKKLKKQKAIINNQNNNGIKKKDRSSNSSKFSVIVGSFRNSISAQKVIKNKKWTIIKAGKNFRICAYDSASEAMAELFLKDIRKSIPDAWILKN